MCNTRSSELAGGTTTVVGRRTLRRATSGVSLRSPDGTPRCRMTTTEQPASLISTLPGQYYTDPAIFSLEQSHVFEDMWFCAVRSSDLPTPASFKKVQVGRESVLVVRSRNGQLRAFLNICRHRGAQICTDDSGQVKRAF